MFATRLLSIAALASSFASPYHGFSGPAIAPAHAFRASAALVELRGRSSLARPVLRRARARIVSRELRLWRVPKRSAVATVRALRHAHIIVAAEPERYAQTTMAAPFADPLYPTEWWRAAVGADGLTAPGAGIPITIVDSGVDLTHPEFAQRADTSALNAQSLTDTAEDFHGTAVASVAAAPANGAGIVGVYPTAAVRSWDAGRLSNADVIAGIVTAARRGPAVINLSLGYPQPDPMIEQAVLVAFGEGSVVVASAGNDFENGNPLIYPASLPHVLTVAATDEGNRPTSFSSSSEAVDLAAPGQNIVAAVPLSFDSSGYRSVDGTSFSAPIVTAATAWVWSVRRQLDNTQVFDLMRWSARDIWHAGFDPDTGFGLLDLPAALSSAAPRADPQEPNDDVYEVKPNGLFRDATAPLTRGAHGSAHLAARLDFTEDPVDVYRVWIPAHKAVKVRAAGDGDVDLAIWRPTTASVAETGAARQRDLLGSSAQTGTTADVVSATNPGRRGEYVYAEVSLGAEAAAASYTLSVSTLRAKH
jgi:hypothetical protein